MAFSTGIGVVAPAGAGWAVFFGLTATDLALLHAMFAPEAPRDHRPSGREEAVMSTPQLTYEDPGA